MNRWLQLFTRIHIHPVFWIVIAAAIMTARFYELLFLFIIVFFHELGHAVAAMYYNWRIKQIFLLPFGGALELDEYGNRPMKEEFIVTIAGPLQHIWMVALAFFLYQINILSFKDYSLFLEYNFMILIFNGLPILPLDGGKLMSLALSYFYPFQQAFKKGILFSIFFLCVYSLAILLLSPFHISGWVIIVFLIHSLYSDWKNRTFLFMRFLIEKSTHDKYTYKKVKTLRVQAKESIQQVVSRFYRGMYHTIIVFDNGKEIGTIPETQILKRYFENQSHTTGIKDLIYYR